MLRARQSRPFTVLLVSEQRELLRRLSTVLSASGHEVRQVADHRQVAVACEAYPVDLAIVDADDDTERVLPVVRELANMGHDGARCYILLLTSSHDQDGIERSLEAGVDDFLAKPVVYGELLARLRAGARELEYERRLREQIAVEPVTGLPGRKAFEARLKAELSSDDAKQRGAACSLLDLDFLRRVSRIFGERAADSVLRTVAARLSEWGPEADTPASFGTGRFAFLLPGMSETEGAAWAERLRQRLAEEEFPGSTGGIHLTCSAGVADVHGSSVRTAEDVLHQASAALQAAKSFGRNCVVRFTELDEDAKAWADFAAPGKLFERTVAKDIMTPCPRLLQASEPADLAAELLRQTHLEAMAVVDGGGRLLGLVHDRRVFGALTAGNGNALKVSDVMIKDVAVYEEGTRLAALREFFQRDAGSHVVIARDRRPVGLVTVNNLAALGSKLTSGTFMPEGPFCDGSEYLVVPDLCPTADLPGSPTATT